MDALLDEAYRRACIGVDEPVIYQGQLAMTKDAATGEDRPLTVRKHSDRLLEVMLKFRYGDQLADRLRVKVEDTGLDADALLRMPSEERKALTEPRRSTRATAARRTTMSERADRGRGPWPAPR